MNVYSWVHASWVPRDGQHGSTRRVEAHQNDTVETVSRDEEAIDEEETAAVSEKHMPPTENRDLEEESRIITEIHLWYFKGYTQKQL